MADHGTAFGLANNRSTPEGRKIPPKAKEVVACGQKFKTLSAQFCFSNLNYARLLSARNFTVCEQQKEMTVEYCFFVRWDWFDEDVTIKR
jgi:hypothetical protein